MEIPEPFWHEAQDCYILSDLWKRSDDCVEVFRKCLIWCNIVQESQENNDILITIFSCETT